MSNTLFDKIGQAFMGLSDQPNGDRPTPEHTASEHTELPSYESVFPNGNPQMSRDQYEILAAEFVAHADEIAEGIKLLNPNSLASLNTVLLKKHADAIVISREKPLPDVLSLAVGGAAAWESGLLAFAVTIYSYFEVGDASIHGFKSIIDEYKKTGKINTEILTRAGLETACATAASEISKYGKIATFFGAPLALSACNAESKALTTGEHEDITKIFKNALAMAWMIYIKPGMKDAVKSRLGSTRARRSTAATQQTRRAGPAQTTPGSSKAAQAESTALVRKSNTKTNPASGNTGVNPVVALAAIENNSDTSTPAAPTPSVVLPAIRSSDETPKHTAPDEPDGPKGPGRVHNDDGDGSGPKSIKEELKDHLDRNAWELQGVSSDEKEQALLDKLRERAGGSNALLAIYVDLAFQHLAELHDTELAVVLVMILESNIDEICEISNDETSELTEDLRELLATKIALFIEDSHPAKVKDRLIYQFFYYANALSHPNLGSMLKALAQEKGCLIFETKTFKELLNIVLEDHGLEKNIHMQDFLEEGIPFKVVAWCLALASPIIDQHASLPERTKICKLLYLYWNELDDSEKSQLDQNIVLKIMKIFSYGLYQGTSYQNGSIARGLLDIFEKRPELLSAMLKDLSAQGEIPLPSFTSLLLYKFLEEEKDFGVALAKYRAFLEEHGIQVPDTWNKQAVEYYISPIIIIFESSRQVLQDRDNHFKQVKGEAELPDYEAQLAPLTKQVNDLRDQIVDDLQEKNEDLALPAMSDLEFSHLMKIFIEILKIQLENLEPGSMIGPTYSNQANTLRAKYPGQAEEILKAFEDLSADEIDQLHTEIIMFVGAWMNKFMIESQIVYLDGEKENMHKLQESQIDCQFIIDKATLVLKNQLSYENFIKELLHRKRHYTISPPFEADETPHTIHSYYNKRVVPLLDEL